MTCAKKIVRCTIITKAGYAYSGENDCWKPQKKCPREVGEDYTKCNTVCEQYGHAEIKALQALFRVKDSAEGATAIITGIDYVCKECARSLSKAGVAEIIIRHQTSR